MKDLEHYCKEWTSNKFNLTVNIITFLSHLNSISYLLPHNFRFMPINKDNRVLNVLLCKQKGKRFANLSLRNGSYNIKCRSLPIAFICNVKHIFLLVNLKFWWIEFLNLPHFVCFNVFFSGIRNFIKYQRNKWFIAWKYSN